MQDSGGSRGFREAFGAAPAVKVHAPGRVNLVGEHIDYADLAVLPMAIDRGVAMWCRPCSDPRVRIVNADARYGTREFDLELPIPAAEAGDWGNYAKAALQGLAEAGVPIRGFDAWVGGDLPPAAGLSSSSALVVATALAALAVVGEEDRFSDVDLAGRLAAAEQYVGVRGGGMDQAAILCGRAGCALRVSFSPLDARPIRVPADWAFVVAHSLDAAEKSGSARAAYNERRADVEEAVRRVTTCLGGSPPAASCRALVESRSSAELLEAAERLPDRLRRRLRHVVTEAARVEEAVAALEAGRSDAFGAAMSASHASLREDFDVSTPALDELVAAAMAAGATGARLTGAGLGGCVVALVPRRGAADLLGELSERFYRPRGASTGSASLDSPLAFIVSASGPASASRA